MTDPVGYGTITIVPPGGGKPIVITTPNARPGWKPPPDAQPKPCSKDPNDCWGKLPSDNLRKIPIFGVTKQMNLDSLHIGCLECCIRQFNNAGDDFNKCEASCEAHYLAEGGHGINPNVLPSPRTP